MSTDTIPRLDGDKRMAAQLNPELVDVGVNRMEARHPVTWRLLGTAIRNSHPDSEWIGWLVECNNEQAILIARGPTKELLRQLATARLAGE